MKKLFLITLFLAISLTSFSQEKKWNNAQKKNTIESYQKFLQKYPASVYSEDARFKLKELEYSDSLEFHKAKVENTFSSYEKFIVKNPHSPNLDKAKLLRNEAKIYSYYITNSNYNEYLKIFEAKYTSIYAEMLGYYIDRGTYPNVPKGNPGVLEYKTLLLSNVITLQHFDLINMFGCFFKKSNEYKQYFEGALILAALPIFAYNFFPSVLLTQSDKLSKAYKNALYGLIIDVRKNSDFNFKSGIKKWIEGENDLEFKMKLQELLD